MLMETYLRQQVEKGEYGVAIIQAQIALDIADYIEKHRQPERKTGRWIDGSIPTYAACSECGYQERYAYENNFCPHCGADMRGDKEEGDPK